MPDVNHYLPRNEILGSAQAKKSNKDNNAEKEREFFHFSKPPYLLTG
jgi:hypothetical protein